MRRPVAFPHTLPTVVASEWMTQFTLFLQREITLAWLVRFCRFHPPIHNHPTWHDWLKTQARRWSTRPSPACRNCSTNIKRWLPEVYRSPHWQERQLVKKDASRCGKTRWTRIMGNTTALSLSHNNSWGLLTLLFLPKWSILWGTWHECADRQRTWSFLNGRFKDRGGGFGKWLPVCKWKKMVMYLLWHQFIPSAPVISLWGQCEPPCTVYILYTVCILKLNIMLLSICFISNASDKQVTKRRWEIDNWVF